MNRAWPCHCASWSWPNAACCPRMTALALVAVAVDGRSCGARGSVVVPAWSQKRHRAGDPCVVLAAATRMPEGSVERAGIPFERGCGGRPRRLAEVKAPRGLTSERYQCPCAPASHPWQPPARSRSGRSRSRARGGRGRELGAHRGPVSARCRYNYKNRFLVGGKVVYMCNTN